MENQDTTPAVNKHKQIAILVALFLAGGMQTLTYAPFGYWPLGILSAALTYFCIIQTPSPRSTKRLFAMGWCLGFGIFSSGASWVYVSIHDYGYTSAPLAIFLTGAFVALLALFHGFQFILFGKLCAPPARSAPLKKEPKNNTPSTLLAFCSAWVITDWIRSWILTGFPWLYLGHGHLDSPLSGWAPVLGVYGITLIVVFTGAAIASLISSISRIQKAGLVAVACVLFATGYTLKQTEWTQIDTQKPISVAIIQGNIDQLIKWEEHYQEETLETYRTLSRPFWGKSIILWPETAIPIFQHQATGILGALNEMGKVASTTLVTGIPTRQADYEANIYRFYNSILSLGDGHGLYHKQKLVPFGEYVPLEDLLRGAIQFFNLPMSSFSLGPKDQPHLSAGPYQFASFICYEIVYPDFVATQARDADFLITISNDAWFGASIGPLQHLEIAQMRALETGRYLLRGTNSGVSAIVAPNGRQVGRSKQFVATTLEGTIYPAEGSTPFMTFGSTPLILILFIAPLALLTRYRLRHSNKTKG
ncbi:apolipoprotein N-acyltransferase [Oleiphilus messinensis]|uniref:Apolipoprotein N-acyltransferase n=1 Tax=Oleiphilus messinensis TaxID=141451 RepID=A0A1Y0I623_9GAMM|nr:apolipoprotein N-acyltransferase [Oleiphilus messinensis]ARU55937.1 apolipoprotein N-acyltransferase [Oleiphilus messinensis]